MSTRNLDINGVPTVFAEVAYNGHPVITEISKRDIEGNEINKTYLKINDLVNKLKTINGESLIGVGDITLSQVPVSDGDQQSSISEEEVRNIVETILAERPVTTITKDDIGLGNVNNTSDLNKPISAAVQSALDLKQDILNLDNKLSASLISTDSEHRFVSDSDINRWNNNGGTIITPSNPGANYTFDNVPTEGSNNPVTSTGIKNYVDSHISSLENVYYKKDSGITTHEYLYVNGEKVMPVNGEVVLEAQSKYVLKGYLKGHITIDGSSLLNTLEDEREKTILILDGLYIDSDRPEAILYDSSLKSLQMILPEKKENFFVYEVENIPEQVSDKAVLQSNNNLGISGSGYLVIRSNGKVHGIKADDIEIKGYPHIYIDLAYGLENMYGHDGIHASDKLTIVNGYFEIKNTNDAIGTGDNALVEIYAGQYELTQYRQSAIDTKHPTIKGKIYKSEFLGFSDSYILTNTEIIDPRIKYGEGKVTRAGATILPSGDGYNITTGGSTSYMLSGIIQQPISSSADVNKVNLELSNAILIADNYHYPIEYKNSRSRIQIRAAAGTVNYIFTESSAAIFSNNNIEITGDGQLFICGVVKGSHIAIKGDGNKYFYADLEDEDEEDDNTYNIIGTRITFGAEYDDDENDPTVYESGDKITGSSQQNIYISNGVHARKSKNNAKSYISFYDNQKEDIFIDGIMDYEVAPSAQPEPSGIYYSRNIDMGLIHIGSTDISDFDYEYKYFVSELVSTVSTIEDRITALENKEDKEPETTVDLGLPAYPNLEEGERAILSVSMVDGQYVLSWLKAAQNIEPTPQPSSNIENISVVDENGETVNIVVYDEEGNPIQGIIYDETL